MQHSCLQRDDHKPFFLSIHFRFAHYFFFQIHLELKTNKFITPVVPSKTIPLSRPKWAQSLNTTKTGPFQVAHIYLSGLYKVVPPGDIVK